MNLNDLLTKLVRIGSKVGNAIMLNLLFIFACIPGVTIGPAWCGLLSAVRYEIRGDKWFAGFRAGFRTRFLRSMITGVIGTVVVVTTLSNAYSGIAALKDGSGGALSTIFTFLLLLLAAIYTAAFLVTNVYFDRNVETWSDYAFMLVQRAPLQILITAVLMWMPVASFIWDFGIFILLVTILLVAYFVLSGVVMTGLLKNGLLTILAKDRKLYPPDDESEDEE